MRDFQTVIIILLLIVIVVLLLRTQSQARKQYLAWREKELESLRQEQSAIARREAVTQLDAWKMDSETAIRQDAIARSQAVNLGKITEHLIPYMSGFPYNPKDARFFGSPVDLIVFDGMDEGCVRDVVFLEIKTGSSALNARQRQIRDAITSGRVRWRELRL
ncbi:MAG TPA: Holliday junction resolvase-like protein [Armatimonadota bacterium]|nr:Holliday junction resolvase-like protein [Armatimonadota bacterium]